MTGTEVASTAPLRSTMSARSDWIEPPRAATRCVGSAPSRSSDTYPMRRPTAAKAIAKSAEATTSR